jgi:hypothetical protein
LITGDDDGRDRQPLHILPVVDAENLAGDAAAAGAGEIDNGGGDVGRLDELAQEGFVDGFLPSVPGSESVPSDDVHADAEAAGLAALFRLTRSGSAGKQALDMRAGDAVQPQDDP